MVYEAIESSEEPWWGLGILAQPRMADVRNDKRINDMIRLRYQYIIETISTSLSPWQVIWNMQSYIWFLEMEDTIDAIALAVRTSSYPAQVFADI